MRETLEGNNLREETLFLRDNALNENIKGVDERATLKGKKFLGKIKFLKGGIYCVIEKNLKLKVVCKGITV